MGGPEALASRIFEAVDEDGLSEKHRLEADEAASIAGLAQEVLHGEAPDEKPLRGSAMRQRASGVASPKYLESGDVWIMRKR